MNSEKKTIRKKIILTNKIKKLKLLINKLDAKYNRISEELDDEILFYGGKRARVLRKKLDKYELNIRSYEMLLDESILDYYILTNCSVKKLKR